MKDKQLRLYNYELSPEIKKIYMFKNMKKQFRDPFFPPQLLKQISLIIGGVKYIPQPLKVLKIIF